MLKWVFPIITRLIYILKQKNPKNSNAGIYNVSFRTLSVRKLETKLFILIL